MSNEAELIDSRSDEATLLKAMSTRQLRQEFEHVLSVTAQSLHRLAVILRELEERGEDLDDLQLRVGFRESLRKIAHGQVLPEIVSRFQSQPMLMTALSALPIPDQTKLLGDGAVIVLEDNGDHRKVPLEKLGRSEILQVFAKDHVRDLSEQRGHLKGRVARPEKKRPQKGRVTVDHKRNGITVGKSFVALEDVLLALAELANADYDETLDDATEESVIVVRLTAAQHQQLKVKAAKSKAPMTILARRAMAAAGMFSTAQASSEET